MQKSHTESSTSETYQTFNHLSSHRFQFNQSSIHSFNNDHTFKIQKIDISPSESQMMEQHSQSGSRNQSMLAEKYSSLCLELKGVNHHQLITLLLEEIDQNQNLKMGLDKQERDIARLEMENNQMKKSLTEKHDKIKQLCEAQSRSLDLLQTLQAKMQGICISDRYYQKYRELQANMEDYISSTNEATQEFMRKIIVLKQQNSHFIEQHAQISKQSHILNKIVKLTHQKQHTIQSSLEQIATLNTQLTEKVAELEEENGLMKKDIEMLIETIKANEQFEIDINKDNKEVSSSLEFLRDRLNSKLDISKEDDSKNKENQEIQKLKIRVGELNQEREKLIGDHNELMEDYQRLCSRVEQLSKDNQRLVKLIDQNSSTIQSLKCDFFKKQNSQAQLQAQPLHERQSNIIMENQQDSLDKQSSKSIIHMHSSRSQTSAKIPSSHVSFNLKSIQSRVMSRFETNQNESNHL